MARPNDFRAFTRVQAISMLTALEEENPSSMPCDFPKMTNPELADELVRSGLVYDGDMRGVFDKEGEAIKAVHLASHRK